MLNLMNGDMRQYFSVKAFILHKGNYLIMHGSQEREGWWELPGGRMEFGETAEETVTREMLEETGLVVEPVKLLDTWNLVGDGYQITGIIYLCRLENGEVVISEEHDRYQWQDADVASIEILHPVFRKRMVRWDWNRLA